MCSVNVESYIRKNEKSQKGVIVLDVPLNVLNEENKL